MSRFISHCIPKASAKLIIFTELQTHFLYVKSLTCARNTLFLLLYRAGGKKHFYKMKFFKIYFTLERKKDFFQVWGSWEGKRLFFLPKQTVSQVNKCPSGLHDPNKTFYCKLFLHRQECFLFKSSFYYSLYLVRVFTLIELFSRILSTKYLFSGCLAVREKSGNLKKMFYIYDLKITLILNTPHSFSIKNLVIKKTK